MTVMSELTGERGGKLTFNIKKFVSEARGGRSETREGSRLPEHSNTF